MSMYTVVLVVIDDDKKYSARLCLNYYNFSIFEMEFFRYLPIEYCVPGMFDFLKIIISGSTKMFPNVNTCFWDVYDEDSDAGNILLLFSNNNKYQYKKYISSEVDKLAKLYDQISYLLTVSSARPIIKIDNKFIN